MSPEFSVADVLAWARTKPASASYNYQDSLNCALCQFLKDTDRASSPIVSPYGSNGRKGSWVSEGKAHSYDEILEPALDAGVEPLRLTHPYWTFGALVKRLEKLCPETPDYARIEAYLADLDAVEA